MPLKFTIIDYTTDPGGVETLIDEPVGWDGIGLRLKRDKTWRGFFDFADDSFTSMRFIGNGYSVIKTAYELQGAAAEVHLKIEYACNDTAGYDTVYTGRLVFSSYSDTCGDTCFVEIGMEAANCLMKFKNRYDQKVDLDSLSSFDNLCEDTTVEVTASFVQSIEGVPDLRLISLIDIIYIYAPGSKITVSGSASNDGTYTVVSCVIQGNNTNITVAEDIVYEQYPVIELTGCLSIPNLPAYDELNKQYNLPTKTIEYRSRWQSNVNTSYSIPFIDASSGAEWITPNWENVISEVQDTLVGGGAVTYQPILGESDNVPDNLIDYRESFLRCSGIGSLRIKLEGSFTGGAPSTPEEGVLNAFYMMVVKARDFPNFTTLTPGDGTTFLRAQVDVGSGPNYNFSYETTVNDIEFEQGEKLFVYFWMTNYNSVEILMNLDQESYFEFTLPTDCTDTPVKLYAINEAMSRCVEAYTNDCMRVYSDYYGRTNAQPYSSDVNGCGGLRMIGNGLKIRNAPGINGGEQRMTVSMKEIFNALSAIDNAGMGLEADPNRPGYNLIRVEPVEHFFNSDVLMVCNAVNEVKRSIDQSIIYSVIKTGYAKYETWNVNGLFDIFGNREYRTEISELTNELNRLCQFIASDYAIEVTRRQYGIGTSDWRYDNDIFILCFSQKLRVEANFNVNSGDDTIVIYGSKWEEYFNVGDSITVSGSVSNNGTYTITTVTSIPDITIIRVAEPLVNEATAYVFFENNTTPIYAVEQGVDGPANISYPDTVMNYRISPARNTLRLLKSLLQTYRQYADGQIVFTAGTGNILAGGTSKEPCIIEVGPLSESSNIKADNLQDPESGYPLYWPELVTFEYPVTWEQYLTIKANPYGLIGYSCGNGPVQYGWIEDFQLKPYTGMGQFTLRPKIES